MKVLPFKTLPKKADVVEVGNEEIGVLEVPKYGCLTVNETEALNDILKAIDNNTPLADIQIQAAALLIQSRIDKNFTVEDLRASTENPEAGVRMPLIEALYQFFFENERSRWAPDEYLLRVTGAEAEAAATSYANSVKAIASYEKPLNEADKPSVYYVFKEDAVIPESLVRVDGGETVSPKSQGKVKPQTGEKSTSN